jgi:hypothetical protein
MYERAMSDLQQAKKRTASSLAPLLLLLLALGVGGGCIYWFLSDSAPAWFSVLLPPSPYKTTGSSSPPPDNDRGGTAPPVEASASPPASTGAANGDGGSARKVAPAVGTAIAPPAGTENSLSLPFPSSGPDTSQAVAPAVSPSFPPSVVRPGAGEGLSDAPAESNFVDDDSASGPPASAPLSEQGPSETVADADLPALPALQARGGPASEGAQAAGVDGETSSPSPPPSTPLAQDDPAKGTGPENPARSPSSPAGVPEPSPLPLIRYSKGKAVNGSGSIAGGEVPLDRRLAAASSPSPGADAGPDLVLRSGRDSVVDIPFIEDLAAFLAASYWPTGTHPQARSRGITTASLKWINLKYGGQLQGFRVNRDSVPEERARVLGYLYMPSMIQGLYTLYHERFFSILERDALAQKRGPEKTPFTNSHMADMFSLYAGMARGLSGSISAYAGTPDIRDRIRFYAAASDAATAAYMRFSEVPPGASGRDHAARLYQEAVIKREQQRENVAAALRRSADSGNLDSDSLVYAALWLYRRGEARPDTLNALNAMFDACARQFSALERQYRARPAGKFAQDAGR